MKLLHNLHVPSCAARPYPQDTSLVLISVRGWVDPRATVEAWRIKSVKNPNDHIGKRTRDLPPWRAVLQPTASPRTPPPKNYNIITKKLSLAVRKSYASIWANYTGCFFWIEWRFGWRVRTSISEDACCVFIEKISLNWEPRSLTLREKPELEQILFRYFCSFRNHLTVAFTVRLCCWCKHLYQTYQRVKWTGGAETDGTKDFNFTYIKYYHSLNW
jgi:hypothetical protein